MSYEGMSAGAHFWWERFKAFGLEHRPKAEVNAPSCPNVVQGDACAPGDLKWIGMFGFQLFYLNKMKIHVQVLPPSPAGEWRRDVQHLYNSAVFMVYRLMQYSTDVCKNSPAGPGVIRPTNAPSQHEEDPVAVPSHLTLQILTIADQWDMLDIGQQAEDVREILELLQACWSHALTCWQQCQAQLEQFLQVQQLRKQRQAFRGFLVSSSKSTNTSAEGRTPNKGCADTLAQTEAAARAVTSAWEDAVDVCAWCVHVILSRLAHPLSFPLMYGFLPLATSTMQLLSRRTMSTTCSLGTSSTASETGDVISRPSSSAAAQQLSQRALQRKVRGLLHLKETRGGFSSRFRVGGAVAAASVGSFLLDLPQQGGRCLHHHLQPQSNKPMQGQHQEPSARSQSLQRQQHHHHQQQRQQQRQRQPQQQQQQLDHLATAFGLQLPAPVHPQLSQRRPQHLQQVQLCSPKGQLSFLVQACAFTLNLRLLLTQQFNLIKRAVESREVIDTNFNEEFRVPDAVSRLLKEDCSPSPITYAFAVDLEQRRKHQSGAQYGLSPIEQGMVQTDNELKFRQKYGKDKVYNESMDALQLPALHEAGTLLAAACRLSHRLCKVWDEPPQGGWGTQNQHPQQGQRQQQQQRRQQQQQQQQCAWQEPVSLQPLWDSVSRMEGSQTSSTTTLPGDFPESLEHAQALADSMTEKLLASQAFEPERRDSLRDVMRTYVSERYSEGLVEELGKANTQHAREAKGADDIQDACKTAEELLRAHRDTLALPMLDMMQIFDQFKELRLGTPTLLAVELAWQQALAVARITHHSSEVLACHATSGLGVPVLKRIKERPARSATDIAISGLFECSSLDNVPEKDRRQICRMHARRFPPTPELRAQLLRLVVDMCHTAPLTTNLTPVSIIAGSKWWPGAEVEHRPGQVRAEDVSKKHNFFGLCVEVCVALPLENLSTHLSREDANKRPPKEVLERLAAQYILQAKQLLPPLDIVAFHAKMQDILSPITARASNFSREYDGKGQPEPAVMANSFPAIPMCRVLALLLALPGCSKVLDMLAESCAERFMLLSLQLGEYTGLYLHKSLSNGGGRVFDKFMEGMKAVPVPARGAVLQTLPGLDKLGPVISGGALCTSDAWTHIMSSPFAVGLTLFNDALTQIWYGANKAPVPSSPEAPLSTEAGSTSARQKVHKSLTNAAYKARGVRSLKPLFDLGPANPFCPIACANASCDRLGEVLKPHLHPTGVGSNWEAPAGREWFWNFSNDATRQTFYFHCDECWKEFRATSLDLHAALHCTGWL